MVLFCSSHESSSREDSPLISIDDMFDDFFGSKFGRSATPSAANTDNAIDGNQISEGIGICPASSWTLVAAAICNDHLIMCRKCRKTESMSYLLLQSNNTVQLSAVSREISIPSFVCNHQILSFGVVDTGRSVGSAQPVPRTKTMHVNPVFIVVQSADHPCTRCTSMTAELYLALFGPEFGLSKAPVLIIGMQNGKIYFTNFGSNTGGKREDVDNLLGPLYDLEQPVVGLHVAYFPPEKLSSDDDPMAISWGTEDERQVVVDTPNALIFVGQRGKVAICCSDPSVKKCFHSFVEFQVPGPVISTVLIPRQSLLFTTLQGLYRVCLRQDCAKCIEEKMPSLAGNSCNIRIPRVSFSFPEKILTTRCPAYILKTRTSDEYYLSHSESGSDPIQCSCASVDGSIATTKLTAHANGQTSVTGGQLNAEQVGREIKECLDAIQVTGKKISQTRKNVESLNNVLTVMRSNLELLCAVGNVCSESCGIFHSCSPFTCSFASAQECVGLRIKRLYFDVSITYSRPKTGADLPHRLGPGWSFLIKSSSLHPSGSSFSKSVSISGMAPEDSVSLRTEVDFEDSQVLGAIQCFIYFTPQPLCASNLMDNNVSSDFTRFQGISLYLCSKVVTVLDFATQCKQILPGSFDESLSSFKRKATSQALSSEPSQFKLSPLGPNHSISLSISPYQAIRTIMTLSAATAKEDLLKLSNKLLGIRLLHALPPRQDGKGEDTSNVEGKMCTVLDGPCVSFEIRDRGLEVASDNSDGKTEPIQLLVRSSSKQSLVTVAAAVHAILTHHSSRTSTSNRPGVTADDDQFCEVLEGLRRIARDAGSMREELTSAHQQLSRNCLPLDAYESKVKSIRSRTFAAFCKLRELNSV